MGEDKQIYAYSWRKDLVKKIKEYFKKRREGSSNVLTQLETTNIETPEPKAKTAKEIRAEMKAEKKAQKLESEGIVAKSEEKNQKTKKKIEEVKKESPLIKKEKKEKVLTLALGSLIVVVMSGAMFMTNKLVSKPIPASKTPASEVSTPTPNPTITSAHKTDTKKVLPTKASSLVTPPSTGCKISGCNGEICADESLGDISTICIYEERYECYKSAVCERQASGNCGWTQTSESKACLTNYD